MKDQEIEQLRTIVRIIKQAAAETDAALGAVARESRRSASKRRRKTTNIYSQSISAEASTVLRNVLRFGSINRKDLSQRVTNALFNHPMKDELKPVILNPAWQHEQYWLQVDANGNLSLR